MGCRKRFWTLALSLLMGKAGAAAPPDTALGQRIAAEGNGRGAIACAGCHGDGGDGSAAAVFPRLAGLEAGYLAKQLRDYRRGERRNPIMEPAARALSPEEIAAVSAWYAGLAPAGAKGADPDAGLVARGEELALFGDWEREVPACMSCHGMEGGGLGPEFPALAGQHASYITSQLAAWKAGTRRNDPVEMMRAVAERLTPEESAAVAAYYAALEPAR